MKNIYSTNDRRNVVGWVVGIAAALAVLAMFVGIIAFSNSRNVGVIAYKNDVRRGNEQRFVYLKNDNLKKGDTVTWYVDGERVTTYAYDGEKAEFIYTPTKVGSSVVTVVAGKYNRSTTVNVKKPLLTLTAKDITVTYGEEIPQAEFECCGLVGEDTLESLNCNVCCRTAECSDAGVYEITLDEVDCPDYEVAYHTGHLTIQPREIEICNNLEKEYDQTNVLQSPTLQLDGVLEGDEVKAVADQLYFENKNAGTQRIVTANIQLVGKDSCNYVLCNELQGRILPKNISVEGMSVSDKFFDGTTKATVEKPGKLIGVLEGDSVAIGSLDVTFESAKIGDHKVRVKDICLVGLDKDNYVISEINDAEAEIKALR